ECWDKDPENRPSAIEIYETILKWKNSTEILSEFLKSDKEMVIENNNSFKDMEISTFHTSKFIGYITDEIISDNNICIKDIEKH
ncbi:15870_t:CDS:1, partial [Dentiscutata heterogama]